MHTYLQLSHNISVPFGQFPGVCVFWYPNQDIMPELLGDEVYPTGVPT